MFPTVERVLELWDAGHSFVDIAREIPNVTEGQAIGIVKAFRQPQICPRCGIWIWGEDDPDYGDGVYCSECLKELAQERATQKRATQEATQEATQDGFYRGGKRLKVRML